MASASFDFETGDLSQWDSTPTGGSSTLSATTDAAMDGTVYGMRCTPDPANPLCWGQKTVSLGGTIWSFGGWVDASAFTPDDGTKQIIFGPTSMSVEITNSGGQWQVRAGAQNNAFGYDYTDQVNFSEAVPHTMEAQVTKAGSGGATITLFLDGVQVATKTGFSNDSLSPGTVMVAGIAGGSSIGAGGGGVLDLDEVAINNTGDQLFLPTSSVVSGGPFFFLLT